HTIWAYSVNVIGSLSGIWLFVTLSAYHQPPMVWIIVVLVLAIPFLGGTVRERWTSLLLAILALGLAPFADSTSGAQDVVWSPYQKLAVFPGTSYDSAGNYIVTVNNSIFQGMVDLSKDHTAGNPEQYPPTLNGLTQYDIPLLLHPNPKKFLVI